MQTYTENSLKTSNKREESSTTLWRQTVCLPWGYWILENPISFMSYPGSGACGRLANIHAELMDPKKWTTASASPTVWASASVSVSVSVSVSGFQVQVQLFLLSAWMLALAAVLFRPCRHESGFWYLHNIAMRWLGVVTAIWSDVGAGPFRDNQDRMATIKRNEVAPLTYIHSYGHSHSPPPQFGQWDTDTLAGMMLQSDMQ